MTDPSPVVVIGDALIDEIHGEKSTDEYVGGAALNVAVGLAVLGAPTALIAMVGNDSAGDKIRDYLREHNVTLIATVGPNGSSRAVARLVDGEPRYEFNAAAQARRIDFGSDERTAIDAAPLVVVSCFPFDDVEQSADLLDAVRSPESRLVIDPNPRAGMLHSKERFRDSFDGMVPATLLIKVGDDDARLIYGSTIDGLRAHLLERGARAVVATAGKNGAIVQTASGIIAHEDIATLPGPIVDTVGAGDATLASIIHSMVSGGVPADADAWHAVLRAAMLVAAATCRSEGALLRVP